MSGTGPMRRPLAFIHSAERGGTIFVIHAEVGDSLAVDAVILEFE